MLDYKDIGLDSNLQKMGGLASSDRGWEGAFSQDAKLEKSPYANPTQINKGKFDVTGGGTLSIKDKTGGTTLLTFDPSSGSATLRGDFNHTGNYDLLGDMDITGALTVGGTAITGAYSKGELGYGVTMGGRQWTTSDTFEDIPGSLFRLNGTSFVLSSVYFEVNGCVEVAGRTGYFQIYNVTDSTVVANSTVSATAVSSEANKWNTGQIVRSGTLAIAGGVKTYKLQFKQDTAGGEGTSVQIFSGRMVIVNV